MSRSLAKGMGEAVAQRTILRKIDGEWETWGDVADRVAAGNVGLLPGGVGENTDEFIGLRNHIADGRILMSGRHLQHGDLNQKHRNMEVFTNCATACTSGLSYYNLLNGAGVGRSYDDDMMVVDWDKAPILFLILDPEHIDYNDAKTSRMPEHARCVIDKERDVVHVVQDSREGWAKALEIYETMTFLEQSDKVLVLDFSQVRPSGVPIAGMQGRPSCGPVPTMLAFKNVRDLVVGKGMPKWKQAMYVDHYFADSVLVGGARRAARIAVKYWKDPDILEFISIKRDGGLWSANNSVGVDEDFWGDANDSLGITQQSKVFNAITHASYHDGTGEPGFLNLHKLNNNEEGLDWNELKKGEYVGSKKYQVDEDTKSLLGKIAAVVEHKQWKFIVNPCGEIVLSVLGGFCVIADVVPYHCEDEEDIHDALRHAVRALIRVNTMDSIYNGEVLRTNRVGVGLTGLHEWMWDYQRVGFNDSLRDLASALCVELSLSLFRSIVVGETRDYSAVLGLNDPHTITTIKPAGTTSKLFGLTEGCHLPAMAHYLRWVQFRQDDPLVQDYASRGYPIKHLSTYEGMTAVGFPTKPTITDLIPSDKLVTADEASIEDQFKWLQLLEGNWLGDTKGNQLSYTLNFSPTEVSYDEYKAMILEHVPQVRCVSILPIEDTSAYEYLPNEKITEEQYDLAMFMIDSTTEDIGIEHIGCGASGCPVSFTEGDK